MQSSICFSFYKFLYVELNCFNFRNCLCICSIERFSSLYVSFAISVVEKRVKLFGCVRQNREFNELRENVSLGGGGSIVVVD